MQEDTIKDIINDVKDLASTRKNPLTRLALEGIANRLQALCDKGTYFTPEAVREFAQAQKKADAQPIDLNGPTLNQILQNPPLEGLAKYLSVPTLGIQFRRHKSADMTKLIATWRDDFNDHIYEITVQRDGDSPNCGWWALTTNDGHNVFQLRTKNRSNCEHFALSAMKRYLKIGHRRTYRTLAKKEGC